MMSCAFAQHGVVGPVSPSVPSTAPPLPRGPQRVSLTDRGLAGIAAFGDPMDRALATLRKRLRPPDQEVTNENNPEGNVFGVCPGGRNRYVRWGRLWVLFTEQSRYGRGRWHLFAYYVKGEQVRGRPDPTTQRGIHIGSTVAELRAEDLDSRAPARQWHHGAVHRALRTDLGPEPEQLLPGLALHAVEADELVADRRGRAAARPEASGRVDLQHRQPVRAARRRAARAGPLGPQAASGSCRPPARGR